MKENYAAALAGVLEHEGGYSNDAGDPGGPTKYGITIFDCRAYWKKNATAADVKNLPLSVAKEIYKSKYWDKVDGDSLPSGVDYCIFDYGVNSGISRAAKVLQRLVGTKPDGIIGAHTLLATREHDSVKLISDICDERLDFLHSLKTWRLFGRGWGTRVREVRVASIKMALH